METQLVSVVYNEFEQGPISFIELLFSSLSISFFISKKAENIDNTIKDISVLCSNRSESISWNVAIICLE